MKFKKNKGNGSPLKIVSMRQELSSFDQAPAGL